MISFTLSSIPSRIWNFAQNIFIAHKLRARGVKIGNNVRFHGRPILDRFYGSEISIGNNCVLCSDSKRTALGVRGPVIIKTLSKDANIIIGRDVGLSGTVICSATSITVGDETLFGADVMLFDTDFHPINPDGRRYASLSKSSSAPICIGKNVFVGARSTICKGVSIGDNSVIGAGSTVISDIPENSIYAGVPAKYIRTL